MKALLLALCTLGLLSACGANPSSGGGVEAGGLAPGGVGPPHEEVATRGGAPVHLRRDIEPILMSRCSGEFCHGMSMTLAPRAYQTFVNEPSNECDDGRLLVVPGAPEKSYLVDKILDTNICSGHAMPRGRENQLTGDQVALIVDWIRQGARND